MSYDPPENDGAVLWDAEGNQIAPFTGEMVVDGEPAGAPAVESVAVVSDAGDDDTYALGGTIRVAVAFGEVVEMTGSPRLAIDMDLADWGEKWAAYESGGGTVVLTFAYEVVEPNLSTEGIAVLADSLELDGGAMRSAASGADAELLLGDLGHDSPYKVDWELGSEAEPPTTTGVAVSSRPAVGDIYRLGERIPPIAVRTCDLSRGCRVGTWMLIERTNRISRGPCRRVN